jgi:hypothetical protein
MRLPTSFTLEVHVNKIAGLCAVNSGFGRC